MSLAAMAEEVDRVLRGLPGRPGNGPVSPDIQANALASIKRWEETLNHFDGGRDPALRSEIDNAERKLKRNGTGDGYWAGVSLVKLATRLRNRF